MARLSAADRREDIIQAAGRVLLARGLAAATTRDVTTELGVGVGLLSHYFTWSTLRAEAFERVVRADLEASITARHGVPARRVLSDLVRVAFDQQFDPVWRVWIEAADLASSDEELADRVRRCLVRWQDGLASVLARGVEEEAWTCADPTGAACRLLALLDGLVGMTLPPSALLTRATAMRHLRTALGHECHAFEPSSHIRRGTARAFP